MSRMIYIFNLNLNNGVFFMCVCVVSYAKLEAITFHSLLATSALSLYCTRHQTLVSNDPRRFGRITTSPCFLF